MNSTVDVKEICHFLQSCQGGGWGCKDLCEKFCSLTNIDFYLFGFLYDSESFNKKLVITSNYPQQWLSLYFEQRLYTNDPIMNGVASSVQPVFWEQIRQSNKQFFKLASEYSLCDGVSVPIRNINGDLAILSLAIRNSELNNYLQEVLPFAQSLSFSLLSEFNKQHSTYKSLKFSAREIEVIHWASQGKTSWEIGKILNISRHTVNYHIGNVMKKLNATSRQHALVLAKKSGLFEKVRNLPFPTIA